MNAALAASTDTVKYYYTMMDEAMKKFKPDLETCLVLGFLALFIVASFFAFYLIFKARNLSLKERPQRRRRGRRNNRDRQRQQRQRQRNPRYVNHG
ncbi:hypothetical protein J6590_040794 [Homalodisca vitripennis]|nr:hypothetical protein J6590_040794 [Homalodisca vitripennis]